MCCIPEEPDYAEVDRADGTVSRFRVFRPGVIYEADAELVRSLSLRAQRPRHLQVEHHDGRRSFFRLREVRMTSYAGGGGATRSELAASAAEGD